MGRRLRNHPWLWLAAAIAGAALAYLAVARSELLVEAIGRVPLSIAFLLGWVAVFPQEAKKLGSEFVALLFYWSRRGQRIAVGAGLEADVARANRAIEREVPRLFPRKLRVAWHRGKDGHVDLPDGELILKLRDHRLRDENATSAVLAQLSNSALSAARPYMDREVAQALDFNVANALLEIINAKAAMAFRRDVCLPACEASPRLAGICDEVRAVDRSGLLTRIALREYVELGERLASELPSAAAARQSSEFLNYLHRIATKQPGEDLSGDLKFAGEHIRVGTVLVARPEIYALYGDSAYTQRVGQYAREGVSVVYLIARGSNVEFAKSVARQLAHHGNATSVEEFEFDVPWNAVTRPAYLVRVTLNLRLSRRAERRFSVLRAAGSRTDDVGS